jgi:anaerobic ribonucleoside-triphosphate reductase activating protein
VSGCTLHCQGCHNPESWDFNSGKLFDEAAKQELFEVLSNPWIQGITFSGGHPLANENVEDVYLLVKEIREKFPAKDIWLYTGYTWEQIFPKACLDIFASCNVYRQAVVEMCDVVVDGPYIDAQRDLTLKFRGSKNQRLIDVKKTLEQKEIVLFE